MTDLDEVVPLMEERTANWRTTSRPSLDSLPAERGGQVLVRGLGWGDGKEDQLSLPEGRGLGHFTHLILSDLVYFPFLYPPLLSTLLALTDVPNPPEIIIAYKVRSLFKETPFWDMLGEQFTLVPVLARADGKRFGASDGLGIFVVRRREAGKKREEEVGFEELLFLSMEI